MTSLIVDINDDRENYKFPMTFKPGLIEIDLMVKKLFQNMDRQTSTSYTECIFPYRPEGI